MNENEWINRYANEHEKLSNNWKCSSYCLGEMAYLESYKGFKNNPEACAKLDFEYWCVSWKIQIIRQLMKLKRSLMTLKSNKKEEYLDPTENIGYALIDEEAIN